MGVLNGVRGHRSLRKMTFMVTNSIPFPSLDSSAGLFGVQLGLVPQETASIKELCFESTELAPALVFPLA
jgi:hypothetical protein